MSNLLAREVQEVVLALCEDLATPLSLSVAILVRHREWDQLAVKRTDPRHYIDSISGAYRFRKDTIATSFLTKFEGLPTSGREKRGFRAKLTFEECEHACFRTNERLSPFLFGACTDQELPVLEFLQNVRKRVGRILGPAPKLRKFNSVFEGAFGPGATYSDPAKNSLVPDKITNLPSYTRLSIWLLWQWGNTAWARSCAERELCLDIVRGNRFATALKDAMKFRCIGMEPSINIWYQLFLGRVMKRCLFRYGLPNLKTQAQPIHKLLAQIASVRKHLATLDLSNASDTVSYNLVKLVTPHDWFYLFDRLRSPFTRISPARASPSQVGPRLPPKEGWVRLEKFSSMGNGFTFELETTIFSAIVEEAMETSGVLPLPGQNYSVFGDDIICPIECTANVIQALRFCGFSLNMNKSFWQGAFRESCGGDYLEGLDVRPVFLKKDLVNPQRLITLHNRLRHLAPYGSKWRCLDAVLNHVPTSFRGCRGPVWLGESVVIHSSKTEWVYKWVHNIRYFRGLVTSPTINPPKGEVGPVNWNQFKPDVVMASALYKAGALTADAPCSLVGSPSGDSVDLIPRGAALDFRVAWVAGS